MEEKASMSDLVGGGPIPAAASNGRAQNGGSRATSGPVPVPQYPPARVTTPRDIMRQRQERESRKKAESEARQREQEEAEQQRVQEQRRLSAERRTTNAGVAGGGAAPGTRSSGGQVAVPQNTDTRRQSQRTSTGNAPRTNPPMTAPSDPKYMPAETRPQEPLSAPRAPAERSNVPHASSTRTRSASLSQAQPKPVQSQTNRGASATFSSQQQPSQTRQTSAAGATNQAQAGPSTSRIPLTNEATGNVSSSQPRNTNTSSFPHAFERWETLSSHWEGLTSYWIRRLEANSDETREPLNQQLARQVTDLSAAGANLFHAVVELQRLRASSERKFQRWFFETRTEQEKAQERLAELETALRNERQARTDAASSTARVETERASAEQVRATADQLVKEMRRELQISKEEARRAWEELGRREQEERDRTTSLRNGEPTLVGGVQVVPMMQAASSRQPSTTRDPNREGTYQGEEGAAATLARAQQEEPIESPLMGEPGYAAYDPSRSETDTDPFTEGGREVSSREPDVPPTLPLHVREQTSNTSSAAIQAARVATTTYSPSPQRSTIPASGPTASASGGTYLSYGPGGGVVAGSTTQPSASNSFYQHHGTALHSGDIPQPRSTEHDQRSYIQSADDALSEDEYELDERGEVRRDAQGYPIMSRREVGSENSDEYDVQEQLERERMYGQRYGSGGVSGIEYGSGLIPTTGVSRPAGGVFQSGTVSDQSTHALPAAQVDYTGSGYGAGWEAMPRHHHPTRLSDVLEEDERSRASPSRASTGSRGFHDRG